MKILVTGGTGLVGACIVAGLLEDGHEVRLLVRRPEQVATSLSPYGVPTDRVEVVAGDVLDGEAVAAALDGCAAVVHAAAVFSLDSRRAQEVLATNERAAELVLGQACDAGLDPVVHISSTVALTRFGGSGPDLPLGDIPSPYARSKLASEVVARRLQDEPAGRWSASTRARSSVRTTPTAACSPSCCGGRRGGPSRCTRAGRCTWWTCARSPPWCVR